MIVEMNLSVKDNIQSNCLMDNNFRNVLFVRLHFFKLKCGSFSKFNRINSWSKKLYNFLTYHGWYQNSRQCNRPSPSQKPETVPNPLLVALITTRNLRSKLSHGTRHNSRHDSELFSNSKTAKTDLIENDRRTANSLRAPRGVQPPFTAVGYKGKAQNYIIHSGFAVFVNWVVGNLPGEKFETLLRLFWFLDKHYVAGPQKASATSLYRLLSVILAKFCRINLQPKIIKNSQGSVLRLQSFAFFASVKGYKKDKILKVIPHLIYISTISVFWPDSRSTFL